MNSLAAQQPATHSPTSKLAVLRYLKRDPLYLTVKPYTCLMDVSGITGAVGSNIVPADMPMPIHDIRLLAPSEQPQLALHGFEVARLNPRPDPTRFTDRRWITDIFYTRVREIVLEKTGARDARVFEHQVRYRHPGFGRAELRGPTGFDAPAHQVHADQTPAAARARLKSQWPEVANDNAKMSCRLGIVNVWIPLVEKVTEWPLALCDSRTVRHDRDFQSSDVVRPDRIGESYMAYHHPEHVWYFLSEQTAEEALIFMSWESQPDAPQHVLHTAVDTGQGETPRMSCEFRVFIRY